MTEQGYFEHLASRTNRVLERKCMQGKCKVCVLAHELGYTVSEGDTETTL